jgi:putative polyketide hydroxylase
VLRGKADQSLLDSYHDERQPLATATTQASLANAMSMGRTENKAGVLPRREFLNEQGLIFGASYESVAVIPDGTPPPAIDDPVTEYLPSARPGSRAPHVWLQRGNEQISTVDLIGPHFLLLAGADGEAWRRAAQVAAPAWPPLVAYVIGTETVVSGPDGKWQSGYGVDADGAVLVRPDGYVAWRSRSGVSNPEAALRAAFDSLLGRIAAMA